jgi:hypothetical protein
LVEDFKPLVLTNTTVPNLLPSNFIVNLHSSLILSNSTVSLLGKGLKFIPACKNEPDISSFKQFISEFIRRLKWAAFLKFKSKLYFPPFSLSLKTHPPDSALPISIMDWCRELVFTTSSFRPTLLNPSLNLSPSESRAIRDIRANSSVIIRTADKGGKIVIQDRKNYIFESLRQLNDLNFYKEIDQPIFLQTAKMIKRIVDNLYRNGHITKSQLRFLLPPDFPRPRHFYTLPKIHKDSDKWTIPNLIPPGRPIVSGCNSESAAVEQFIDFHLQPIAKSIPTFIRDSNHLIALLDSLPIQQSDILFSLDVVSLYTNIPIFDGIQKIKLAFSDNPDVTRPDSSILKLLEITLLRNDFKFLDKTYLQTKGTAMGKKYAPSFANIYMHYWEKAVLSAIGLQPKFWKRYIDDIFGIWEHSEVELRSFVDTINNLNPNIKTTLVCSTNRIIFLDCTIFKSNNFLATKVFSKPSDSNRLLHPKSFHPPHTFKGIIKAQILRFLRLSTFVSDFQNSYSILKRSLLDLGYSRALIRQCKLFALKSLGPTSSPFIAFSKGCSPCLHPRCGLCAFICTSKTIQGNSTNSIFPIFHTTSCNSANCIYTIHCLKCPNIHSLYVGETGRSCRGRMNQHLYNIRHNTDNLIANHFNLPNHSISDFRFSVIQIFVPSSISNLAISKCSISRKTKESSWIKSLGTLHPLGLNLQLLASDLPYKLPLIIPFCPSAVQISNLIKRSSQNLDLLKNNIAITPCFKNNKNLQSLLAPTKLA